MLSNSPGPTAFSPDTCLSSGMLGTGSSWAAFRTKHDAWCFGCAPHPTCR
jgi:hypothetical protein